MGTSETMAVSNSSGNSASSPLRTSLAEIATLMLAELQDVHECEGAVRTLVRSLGRAVVRLEQNLNSPSYDILSTRVRLRARRSRPQNSPGPASRPGP